MTSVICPHCNIQARLTHSTEVYGPRHDYGHMYMCDHCGAYVGCHKGTTKPLGTPANKELRMWRMRAHSAFDTVWKHRYLRVKQTNPKYKKGMARGGRYKALAKLMGINGDDCHIGMFDIIQCKHVIEICNQGLLED